MKHHFAFMMPLMLLGSTAAWALDADPVLAKLHEIQRDWAHIKYEIPDSDAQLDAIHNLEEKAAALTADNPQRPEPKIWQGIILSTDAGIVRGISALGKVKQAKQLLEEAIQENDKALDGSAYTSLGTLYYQVPGWPLAFGSNAKAGAMFKKALALNPQGIDPNYFYGDYLLHLGRYADAKKAFETALKAPARPDRALADKGRRDEIRTALAKISKKLND